MQTWVALEGMASVAQVLALMPFFAFLFYL